MVISGCGVSSRGSSEWNVKVGDPVPEFSLKDTDGNIVSSDSLKGKPYAIAIFATWCPPCRMELQALEKDVWQPLKERGVSIVGINYGDEDAQLISTFAGELGVTFPMLVDETGSFRQKAGVSMVPQSLVIGPDGRILDLHVGFTDEAVVSTREELKAGL
jgi:peroxiredoxin